MVPPQNAQFHNLPKTACFPQPHRRPCGSALCGCRNWFESWSEYSSASPFLTPPTISYTCQHSCVFPAFLGCHCKSGQACPRMWNQQSPSSYTAAVTRGPRLPVASQLPPGSKSLPSPWFKAWPQLFNISINQSKVIDMLNDHA